MVAPIHSPFRAEQPFIALIAKDNPATREICGYLRAELPDAMVSKLDSAEAFGQMPADRICSLCIVCDHGGNTCLEALKRVRVHRPECPILLVLELENEELAAAAMRRGVNGYILKTSGYGSRLQAAVSAIVRSEGESSSAGYRENFHALEVNARQFRELVENAAEGILIHVDETPAYVNNALVRILGHQRREDILNMASIYDFVDTWDRRRVLKIMRRLAAGVAAPGTHVFRARRRDGKLLWLENRVNVVTWQGYSAVQCTLADVSERQRATNALRLAVKVANRAGRQVDFEAAIGVTVRWLARGMGWDLAESWVPSAAGDVLEPGPSWCSDRERFGLFMDRSRDQRFRRGEGLVGQVWETGRPEWISDVSDTRNKMSTRSILAKAVGLGTGCAIPISAHHRTVAVLCFFTSEIREHSAELITALDAGAASLGPVLRQIQTEQARMASIAQTETLISNNLDGILVVDEDGHILFANPAAQEAFGRDLEDLRGMPFGAPPPDSDVAEIEIHNSRTRASRVNEMRVADIDWDGRQARLVSLRDVTERLETQQSLEQHQQELDDSRRRFQDFAEASSDWLWEMDENLRFIYFSDRIRVVMGQVADHWIGRTRRELTAESNTADDPKWAGHLADLEAHQPFRNFRYEISLPDGSTRHIAISGMPVFDDNGTFVGYRGSGTDETGQVVAEHRAQESDRRLHGVADRLPGVVFQRLRKPDGRMEYPYLSAGATTLFGVDVHEIQRDPELWTDRIHPEDRPRFHVALDESSRTLEPMDIKLRMVSGSGEDRWFWHRSTPRRLGDGNTVWDCIELDITEQKKAEARIQYLGYHDQLTGLPNRELFVERIGQVLPIAGRNGQSVAVAMLGLKRFKQVNEEFGMAGGDGVLRTAAARFNDCLRPGDTVARLGGDRFLVLLPSVGVDPNTHKPFDRLVEAMEEPFTINYKQIVLTFNMGVAIFPQDGDSAEALIQKADTAQAYFDRWGPGHGYTFYRERMPESETSGLALEKELRDAIESDDQLVAYFQPIYEASTGRLISVETLARWMHPQRGLVPPGEFIQVAEDADLINPLGLKILHQACVHAREWDEAGLPDVVVTVNLSATQIRDPGLAESIKEILRDTGMTPQRLLLEVTESTLIADLDRGSQFMEELVAEGVYFALDDFGVGYSSLSYLGRLPVHALKIDRSFIRDLRDDTRGETTIKAIVALAHALDLHVVAEGIETRQQMAHTRRLGCDTLQGFLLGRPMPAADLEELLGRRECLEMLREAAAPPNPE